MALGRNRLYDASTSPHFVHRACVLSRCRAVALSAFKGFRNYARCFNAMKLLLLDLYPSGALASRLQSILKASSRSDLSLTIQALKIQGTSFPKRSIDDGLSKKQPDLVFAIVESLSHPWTEDLLLFLKGKIPDTPLIVVFEKGECDDVNDLLNLGISDFITLPLTPVTVLPRIWKLFEDKISPESFFRILRKKYGLQELLGKSPAFVAEVRKLPLVAKFESTVIITGETGTGKELFARAIHYLSPKGHQPFIPINCASLSSELAENELFGHEKGAFTSAISSSTGIIQEAQSGTILLDEVDCLNLAVQSKLLRFMQEKEYRRVGSPKIRKADVRIVSATNSQLLNKVQTGEFRRDLFYRLSVIQIALPPLRERLEDIPLLSRHFLNMCVKRFNKEVNDISSGAMQRLVDYEWPGNVRELENVIERAVILCKRSILEAKNIQVPQDHLDYGPRSFKEAKANTIERFEQVYIKRLLASYQGNISKAAKAAKKNRRAFWALIQKYGIEPKVFRRLP